MDAYPFQNRFQQNKKYCFFNNRIINNQKLYNNLTCVQDDDIC